MSRIKKPRAALLKAREFGALVEQAQAAHPDDIQARIFERVRRRDPRRWKSERTMFRLWAIYRRDKSRRPAPPASLRERKIKKVERMRWYPSRKPVAFFRKYGGRPERKHTFMTSFVQWLASREPR